MSQWVKCVVLFLGAGLIYLVYSPGLSGPFLLDDVGNIENAKLNELTVKGLYGVATSNTSGMFGRPVSALSLSLSHYFSGENPYLYKVFNLILHIINSILVYWLTLQLLTVVSKKPVSYESDRTNLRLFSLIVALVWALHPLQVSTVLYVVQRMAQLSTFFVLLALISYLYGRNRLEQFGKGSWITGICVGIFGMAACLSKENGVLLPVYILLIEMIVFGFQFTRNDKRNQFWLLLSLFCFLPLFLGAVTLVVYFDRLTAGYDLGSLGFTLTERLLSESVVVTGYLGTILLPDINKMSLYQDYWEIQRGFSPLVIRSILVLLTALFVAYLIRRILPLASLGILMFFASHCLESTIFPLAIAFEHRNYFGLFGVALFLVALANSVSTRFTNSRVVFNSIFSLMFVVLAFQAHSRSVEWSSEITLNALSVENFPESYASRTSYAVSLMKLGQLEAADDQLSVAKKINPTFAYPDVARLQFNCLLGNPVEELYEVAHGELSYRVIDVTTLSALINLSTNVNNRICANLDMVDVSLLYASAYSNNLHSLTSHLKSILDFEYSSSLLNIGEFSRAKDVVAEMLRRKPGNAMALIQLGRLHARESNAEGLLEVLHSLEQSSRSDKHSYEMPIQQLRQYYSSLSE